MLYLNFTVSSKADSGRLFQIPAVTPANRTSFYCFTVAVFCSECFSYKPVLGSDHGWSSFSLPSSEKKELKFPLLTVNDLMDSVFELQKSMSPEHKWNKAVYALEKNGHFDMTFEWNQALQDEWDKN